MISEFISVWDIKVDGLFVIEKDKNNELVLKLN